jgi:predicted small integral membrane protein
MDLPLIDLQWMAWTLPTALFFGSILLMLAGMTAWQLVSPTAERRGFLPMATTRGDRLFIGLLGSAFLHLGWIALSNASLWFALALSALWLALVLRYG